MALWAAQFGLVAAIAAKNVQVGFNDQKVNQHPDAKRLGTTFDTDDGDLGCLFDDCFADQ